MAHLEKFTQGSIHNLFDHFNRTLPNNSNKNIDSSKSHLNYNLAIHQTLPQSEFLKKRLSEVKLQKRKDVNVVCSWCVTAPKELYNPYDFETFFQKTYDFLENKYGSKNVISAWVHCDETQPHLHFAFIPVVLDKKKNIEKVSAKELITRIELQNFHKDLQLYLDNTWGANIQVLNGATVNGNLTIEQLKLATQKQKFKQTQTEWESTKVKRENELRTIQVRFQNDKEKLLKRENNVTERENTLKSKEIELEKTRKQYQEGAEQSKKIKKNLDERAEKIKELEHIKISVDDIQPPKKLESALNYYNRIKSFIQEKLKTVEKIRKTLDTHIKQCNEREKRLNDKESKLNQREQNLDNEVQTRVNQELSRQSRPRSKGIEF